MKKNIFVLFTLSVFLFFGCNFISTTSFQSDIATVRINFSQNKANPILNARTIDPGYPENLNNLEWTVTYAGSDGLSKTAETKNGAYLFPVGTWIITATADNLNSNGRFTGSKEVTVSTGTNNISLTVEFDKDGSGGFTAEYTLTGELEGKTTADFELFFLKYPSLAEVDIEVPFYVTGNKLTVSNLDVLPAGFYQISLLTTDLEIITLTDDIVEIAANATSHFSGKAYLDSTSRIYYAVEKEGSLYNGYSPAYRASLTSLLERLKTDASWKTATIKLESKIDGFSPASLIDYAGGRHIILVSEADGKIFAEVKDGEVVEHPAQDPGNGGTGSGGTQEPGSGGTGTGSTGTQDPVIPTDPVTYNTLYVSSSGSDSNAGASEMTPLKTLEKAVELLENGGTIYLMSNITLTSGVSIDKEVSIELQGTENITIYGLGESFRNSAETYTSTMFYVGPYGSLSLDGRNKTLTIDGNKNIQSESVSSDDIALLDIWGKLETSDVKICNSNCRAISAYQDDGTTCEVNLSSTIIGDETLTLTSSNYSSASISAKSGAGIYISNGATVSLSYDVTISGIYTSGTSSGGAICLNNGNLEIYDCNITGNYSNTSGGAIYGTGTGYIDIENGTIFNNYCKNANKGNGIYANCDLYIYGSAEIADDVYIANDNVVYADPYITNADDFLVKLIVENCTADRNPKLIDSTEDETPNYQLYYKKFQIYDTSNSRWYINPDTGVLQTTNPDN